MVEITINQDVYETISERIDGTKFDTPEEYVEFVLREILFHENPKNQKNDMDDRDVQEQLESLGYL